MAESRAISEKTMEDLVAANPSRFLGEDGLRLIARQFRIGNYIFDLLYEDRHGAKLIVELQVGTLDRTHTYKILDYYDEYREHFPTEFVDVMVVANRIPVERQRRLRDRGISFREIPLAELIHVSESGVEHSVSDNTGCGDQTYLVKYSSGKQTGNDRRKSIRMSSRPLGGSVERAITLIREDYLDDPDFHSVRIEAQDKARNMLERCLGSMSQDDIHNFLTYMNTESIKGKTDLTRFQRHFTNILAPKICQCPDEFNYWVGKLWARKEADLQDILHEFFAQAPIKGAGTLLPTFVLHLRKPETFQIYTKKLSSNVAQAFSAYQPRRGAQYTKYMEFNRSILDLVARPFHLQPEEIDLVLSQLPKYL